tara:strand:+ start:1026 stop:2777 length:1752 start_codon:yes stop_codon:yes gene_type:complete
MNKYNKILPKNYKTPFSFDQESWMEGFITGLKHQSNSINNNIREKNDSETLINILFGTQTGNSESVAEDLSNFALSNGFKTQINALDDIEMNNLSKMINVAIITSTYGEGEMPDNAQLFWNALSSNTAPQLNNMNYSVLALGDTGYEEFCHAGKLLDTRLEQLGAKRIIKRIDCDVDFEDLAEKWINSVVQKFNPDKKIDAVNKDKTESIVKSWSRKNPYEAIISYNTLLSGPNSNKEIIHYEIDLGDSGLKYEVGDSLSIIPRNKQLLVDQIIERLHTSKDFIPSGHEIDIENLLKFKFEILTPTKRLIEYVEKIAEDSELSLILEKKDTKALDDFKWGMDVLDFMNLNPKVDFIVEKFLDLLKPLQHRTYSISSSLNKYDNKVHLTISSVRWKNKKRDYNGVCSTYLADDCNENEKIKIFFTPNKSFRLPEDKDKDIIMIGPGTGIAPFRAFLQEREVTKSSGKNWLFFGDQTRDNDFIYEDELKDMLNKNILTKLDLAFSRDQKEKLYVQHKIYENKKEFFSWIENGSIIYICGDATKMAKDVEDIILKIISEEKNCSFNDSIDYLNKLKKEKRYLRDVY